MTKEKELTDTELFSWLERQHNVTLEIRGRGVGVHQFDTVGNSACIGRGLTVRHAVRDAIENTRLK